MRIGAWILGLAALASGCTDFVGVEAIAEESAGNGSASSSGSAGSTTAGSASDPTVDTASAGGSDTSGSSTASASGATNDTTESTTGAETTGPTETTSGPSSSTSSTGDSSGSSSSDSSSSSSSGSSSSSTGDMGDALLGMACNEDLDCDVEAGQECCTANDCLDTCMVPCSDVGDCPFGDMGCEHGYCFFPCDDDDADCAAWPGYSCEHGGTLCELP